MTLEIDVRVRRGGFRLDADFAADAAAVALWGPSGSGKSTLAQALLGLLRPERGLIRVCGETLFDSRRSIDLPAHRRRIGAVFQEGRLFPHLSVRSNLLFGRRFAPARSGPSLDEVATVLGLERLLERRPATLSGGERQRVAVGRALLSRPRLLLMDEPLASLDAARKAEILPYLERLRDEAWTPIVYVSHSPDEVRRLSQVVVPVVDGRAGPATATPIALGPGPSWLAARVVGRERGRVVLDLEGFRIAVAASAPPDDAVRLRIDPPDVLLAPSGSAAAAAAILPVTVTAVEGRGPVRLVRSRAPGGVVVAEAAAEALDEHRLAEGARGVALVRRVTIEPDLNHRVPAPKTGGIPGHESSSRRRGAGA